MKYGLFLTVCIAFYSIPSNSQNSEFQRALDTSSGKDSIVSDSTQFFIAYDLGEAIFNEFKSLGGEVGVRFGNNHLLRIAYTHLYLSEKHLSSNFAKAVDGNNVKGKQVGFEVFYDFPIVVKGLYIAPSIGYYDNEYTHTISNETLDQSSFTLGSAISFTETDIFKVKGLYYRLSIPFRFNLTPINETQLGETTIHSNQFDNSIWFFVGFQF